MDVFAAGYRMPISYAFWKVACEIAQEPVASDELHGAANKPKKPDAQLLCEK